MNTGFATAEMSEEERKTVLSNISITTFTTERSRKGILSFDVNEEGLIATCQDGDKGEKAVCIYSSDGAFIRGYSFDDSESCAVEWDGEYINLYFVRSDVIVSLDRDGKILEIKYTLNTVENDSYTSYLMYSTERTVGDSTYIIKNDMGIFNLIALSYSQIAVVDGTGSERIIYDVNSRQTFITVTLFCCIILFFSLVIFIVIRQVKKSQKSYSQSVPTVHVNNENDEQDNS
jgi:hypothetical protein